jgi:hypothetical protein
MDALVGERKVIHRRVQGMKRIVTGRACQMLKERSQRRHNMIEPHTKQIRHEAATSTCSRVTSGDLGCHGLKKKKLARSFTRIFFVYMEKSLYAVNCHGVCFRGY